MIDIDGAVYTMKGQYNHSTQKPYVEILRDGEHYAFMPWSCLTKEQREGWLA